VSLVLEKVSVRRYLSYAIVSRFRCVLVRGLVVMTGALIIQLIAPMQGTAQLNSNTATVGLTATLLESLTVAAAPGAVTFTLNAGGSADGSAPVVITTSWVLGPTRTAVNLYGFFASATAALTDGSSHNIASANVFGQVTTGAPSSYTAFTQTTPFGAAGAGLQLLSQTINSGNVVGTRSDNLGIRIDLTSSPQTPAAVYTGTLSIRAQAL
jgi:hypothetical protein